MSFAAVEDLQQFHWLMDIIQTVDVGIIVVDREFQIHVWNDFMESYSSLLADNVKGTSLFSVNPDIEPQWFKDKCKAVFELKVRSFLTWEQRPYLFKFVNFKPITGIEDYMYQNVVLAPLVSTTGTVEHLAIMIYDVTNKATAKKKQEALQVHLDELPVR